MNNTIICSLPDLIRYSFLQEFSKNIFFLICVLDVLVFLAASIGNTLTLVALRRSQSIHPPSKALFCSLALSDLCVGLVVVPLHFGLMLATIVEVPSLYCALVSPTTVIAFVTASVSLMTTTAIAVDRYLAFCLKLRYKDLVRVKRVVLVLASEWLIGILWAGLWVHSRSASHTVGALANCLCTMTNFVCYLKIFFGLKQRRTFPIPLQSQFESNQIMFFNILIYKKSAKNMFIIYSIMLFCYVPYSLALALQFACGVNSSTFFTLSISYTIILVNSSLNPFVYFWRIIEIRGQVLEMFKKLKSHGHINS